MSDGEKIGLIFVMLMALSVMRSCSDKVASSLLSEAQQQPEQLTLERIDDLYERARTSEQLEAVKNKQAREALEKRKHALLEQYDELQIRLEAHE